MPQLSVLFPAWWRGLPESAEIAIASGQAFPVHAFEQGNENAAGGAGDGAQVAGSGTAGLCEVTRDGFLEGFEGIRKENRFLVKLDGFAGIAEKFEGLAVERAGDEFGYAGWFHGVPCEGGPEPGPGCLQLGRQSGTVGDVAEVAAAADESDGCKGSSQGVKEAFVGEESCSLTLEFGGVQAGQFRSGAVPRPDETAGCSDLAFPPCAVDEPGPLGAQAA